LRRLAALLKPASLDLGKTLVRHELSLMEQGTPLGFFLSVINNVVMLLVFHALFVDRFLAEVPNPWVYLLLGIVQWNLYINVSMAGFGCFIYRQKIVMGFAFRRELLIFSRTGAVFVPYLVELLFILVIALWLGLPPSWKYLLIPVLLLCQFLFCLGLCCLFAFIGVLHKNIIPFWNIMFRLLSFATPIFYLPVHFGSQWKNLIYSWNPFTIFMIWMRDIVGANGFPVVFHPLKILFGSFLIFFFGYFLFRSMERKVGDSL
jgi:ABC-type polysaccharide/polyol phosphate export permease